MTGRNVVASMLVLPDPAPHPRTGGFAVSATRARLDASADFTVLGAAGFVGRALVATLQQAGHRVRPVTRGTLPALLETHRDAGHVIDCIGLTGDFRTRPHDTAEAHVGVTARCLAGLHFTSFLFLSSTRIYSHAIATQEDTRLSCAPTDPSDLYNLTKLAGEAVCLADPRQTVRVARLSNIFGDAMPGDTFLGQLLQEGRDTARVRFRQSAQSTKDYVGLAEVTRLLPLIASGGRQRLYNLAAGFNTSHAAIAVVLRRHFGWHVDFAPGAPIVRFPPIDTARLQGEFGTVLSNLSAHLARLAADGQEVQCSPSTSEADA